MEIWYIYKIVPLFCSFVSGPFSQYHIQWRNQDQTLVHISLLKIYSVFVYYTRCFLTILAGFATKHTFLFLFLYLIEAIETLREFCTLYCYVAAVVVVEDNKEEVGAGACHGDNDAHNTKICHFLTMSSMFYLNI